MNTMNTSTVQAFVEWYNQKSRPFFIKYAKDKVPSLDDEIQRIINIINRDSSTTVCFLGNSGIGKSTLLNALAADDGQLLPAGGVGPLTAQATEVHYAAVPQFIVNYHDRASLWRMVFGIESQMTPDTQTIKESANKNKQEQSSIIENTVNKLNRKEKEEESKQNFENNLRITRLLVTGDQFSSASPAYVIDALRLACAYEPKWNQSISEGDQIRIQGIKNALNCAETKTAYKRTLQSDDRQDFMRDLRDHAAGFLSPLIRNVQVGWPSTLLQSGLILVDLPGIGVASDIYRNVTQSYIQEKARAIILVVDRAGPTETTINILKTTGYWNRLIGASDDPESDLCSMRIVVTKVDDVASEEWRNATEPRPRKREIFARFVEDFKARMKNQITEQLNSMEKSSDEEVNAARLIAKNSILDHLEIHPVSAPEFRKIFLDHEDDMPFIKDPQETGIPQLRSSLVHLAEQEHQRYANKLHAIVRRVSSALKSEIRIIKNKWKEQKRVAKEIEQISEDFQSFFSQKKDEYERRIGSFHQYFEGTVPAEIGRLVAKARVVAQQEINNYLKSLEDTHWATLKAAVKKGGTFDGSRNIDIIGNIIQKFQEPIAAIWSQNILKGIRLKTFDLSKDIEALVGELCTWAEKNATINISPKLLKNQKTLMAVRASRMNQIGQDAVDDLRNVIKARLTVAISQPIRVACKNFIEAGDHEGTGLKQRILILFQSLSRSSTADAEKAAIAVLQERFNGVRKETREAYQKLGHPLEETKNLILGKHREHIEPDNQKREQVMEEIKFVSSTCPIKENML